MIDIHHPVRVVNRVIEQIEIDPVIEKYKGGGTSGYHPRMLLKVVVFAYLRYLDKWWNCWHWKDWSV
jgi:transposase